MTVAGEYPHNCERNHRTYNTLARCAWKRAEWVDGEGPYALLADCRVLTVTLHPTYESAAKAKARIDGSGCGSSCRRNHEIIRLVP
jgi:hypothetical protein